MKKLLIGLLSGTSLFLLAACGDSSQPTEPPKTGSLEQGVPGVAVAGTVLLPSIG